MNNGTEKQTTYANDIKADYKKQWEILCATVISNGGTQEKIDATYGDLVKKVFGNEDALYWIENRGDTIQNLLKAVR